MMDNSTSVTSVLAVAVQPPPVHGQSVLGKALFEHDFKSVQVHRIPIVSSKSIDEVGKFSFTKIVGVLLLTWNILLHQIKNNSRVLYYTAGSGAFVPFMRDVIVLGVCKPFFSHTLIHYHSGDLRDYLSRSNIRLLVAKYIYGWRSTAIRLGKGCPVPDVEFGASEVVTIQNGVDIPAVPNIKKDVDVFDVLFVGNFYKDKGVLDLFEAVNLFSSVSSKRVRLQLVGKVPNDEMQKKIDEAVAKLSDLVEIDGPKACYGDEKWKCYAKADVFVFPTYYIRENVPLVIIEAMGMGLPVIATRWRGVPSLVCDDVTGYLADINDTDAIKERLLVLSEDEILRGRLGEAARFNYESNYTVDKHLSSVEELFVRTVEKYS